MHGGQRANAGRKPGYRAPIQRTQHQIRCTPEEWTIIKLYADKVKQKTDKALLEKAQDEYDLAAYEKAIAEYNANPETFTLDEVEKELCCK